MGRERTEEQIQKIIHDYLDNQLTLKQVYAKYKACPAAVKKWIKERGIKYTTHNTVSEEILSKATTDYINGMLMKDVEAKYKVSHPVIYKYMKRKGIKYTNEHGRKNTVNKQFFNVIDTERKAYWLGFIMADGCVSRVSSIDPRPNRFTFHISSKDREHLKQFNSDIESTYKIRDIIPKGTYSENPMCQLVINSVEFVTNLMKHGICERKTGKEHIPSSIPEELICHFIRGFLDGDGCTSGGRITFCCSYAMAKELVKAISIPYYTIRNEERKECDIVYLVYNKIKPKELISYLYSSSTIHLHRKFINLCS